MTQNFEGPQAVLAGPFMLANGSGAKFNEEEKFDNNDTQVADAIASNNQLKAVIVTEARNRIRESGPGALAIYYDGLTDSDEIVHGVYFVDETYRAGLPELGIAALGAHAMRVTPQGEVGYCEVTISESDARAQLAIHGYQAGDDELAEVVPFRSPTTAALPAHAADTA